MTKTTPEYLHTAALIMGLGLLPAMVAAQDTKPPTAGKFMTVEARREAIRRASVWSPVEVATVDFVKGPDGPGAYAFNEWVDCTYKETAMTGKSPKFTCVTAEGKELKVKYGPRNAEVFGEVLSSRLFWGLGFAADRMYPVRVRCNHCPADPQQAPAPIAGTTEFDPAAIEVKLAGRAMETSVDSGWDWSELDEIGPGAPQNARAHRDAFKLLAAFVQHIDSKPANQRLLCPEGEEEGDTGCRKPVLMVSDLGLTFGRSGLIVFDMNKNSVSLRDWSQRSVWKDAKSCTAQLSQSISGTLGNPKISDAGRAFLASLLVQLSDTQIRDLFETARVSLRSSDPSKVPEKDAPAGTVDEWVKLFKSKRVQILEQTCP
jgi:hypothetical protein